MPPKPTIDISDEEFDFEANERQHKELLKYLQRLIDSNKGNDRLFTEAVQSFLAKLKDFSTPSIQIPSPIVNTDNKDVIKAVNDAEQKAQTRHKELIDVGNKIYECLEYSNKLKGFPVEMIPKRGYGGLIDKVEVKTLIPKQSKYSA